MKKITRAEAKAAGLVRYFTGKPCPHGHVAERFASYGQCVECTVKSRDNWYENNKERAREKNILWHKNNPEAKRLRCAKWAANNRDKVRASIKAHYLANPEKYAAYRANWARANPEKMADHKKKWKLSNRPKVAADAMKRNAAKLRATPAWADSKAIEQYYIIAAFLTAELGVPFEVDHIVPLRSKIVSGLHAHTNMSISLAAWNRSKSNRWWPDMPLPEIERHRCDVGMIT